MREDNTSTPKKERYLTRKLGKTGALWTRVGLTAVFATFAPILTCSIYDQVPVNNFGVRVKKGELKTDKLESGIYATWPVFDKIYHFSNNTVITRTNQIGARGNTKDQNTFSCDTRLHYRIDPSSGLMGLHLGMADDNGYGLLQSLQEQSVNAVVGARPVTDTLADPVGFAQAFSENLKWRIKQNNVPVVIDTLEVLYFHADVTMPIQLKLKPTANGGWNVENMAGPAAIPVPHSDSSTRPFTLPAQTANANGAGTGNSGDNTMNNSTTNNSNARTQPGPR